MALQPPAVGSFRLVCAAVPMLGCGPSAQNPDASASVDATEDPSPTGSDQDAVTSTTSTTGDPIDSSGDSTTDAPAVWPEEELVALFEGDSHRLEAHSLEITRSRVHVGSRWGTAESFRWTIDRATHDTVATSPVGGPLVSTSAFIYTSGYVNGSLLDDWAVVRFGHDGTGEELLATSSDGFFMAASAPDESFFVARGPFLYTEEMWRISDKSDVPSAVGFLGEQAGFPFAYASGRLFLQDLSATGIVELETKTGTLTPLLPLDSSFFQLAARDDLLFVGTEDAVLRVDLDSRTTEALAEHGRVQALETAESATYWVTARTEMQFERLFMLPLGASEPSEIPLDQDAKVSAGYGPITSVAATSTEIFILRTAANHEFDHAGSLWRLPFPE